MKKFLILFLFSFLANASPYSDYAFDQSKYPILPDPVLTPGSIDPSKTTKEICVKGYSKTQRPNSHYTSQLKMKQLGLKKSNQIMSNFEEDHLIPISIGGHPTDEANLWPQSYHVKYDARHYKDRLENKLLSLVCSKKMSLAEAQYKIAYNWLDFYFELYPKEKR